MPTTADEPAGGSPSHSTQSEGNGKKRRLSEHNPSGQITERLSQSTDSSESNNKKRKLSDPLSIPEIDLPEFSLTFTKNSSEKLGSPQEDNSSGSQEWQTIENGRPKKLKKIPKAHNANYPAIEFSQNSRLQSQIKLSDFQNLILYILADGPSPQFVSVRHRPEIRKVVVLMVPGLEKSMFATQAMQDGESREEKESSNDRRDNRRDRNYTSPDEYFPVKLNANNLPDSLKLFSDMFVHLWPVKTPGDDKYGKMHSPLHAILTAPMPKNQDEKNGRNDRKKGARSAREPQGWKNSRTPITEFIHPPEELLESEYVLHPASYTEDADKVALEKYRQSAGFSKEHGWVDTLVQSYEDGTLPDNEIEAGSLTAGRELLAMDCEMCMTGEKEFSLTRISIVSWDGSVILDELVKPDKPIINYLTQYSGITEKMLDPVTTTLPDIQKKLLDILHPRTVLIGHSLNSDLNALKITHPFIVDTSIIFPHPRGPPLKSSLKWLAQRYLNREIQKGHGTTGPGAGHDSIEDARTCLDLVKQKCEKGKEWGSGESQGENLFKRIARTGVRYKNQGGTAIPSPLDGKSSALIDWGEPKKGPGAAASFSIGCHSDEEVVQGVIRAVKGDSDGKEIPGGGVDFVWARLRELEALKGWWNYNKPTEVIPHIPPPKEEDTTTSENKNTAMSESIPPEPASSDTPMTDTNTTSSTSIPASSLLIPPTLNLSTPLASATTTLTSRIKQIYDSLPPCTAFIIYSGSGDPREMSRLQNMQTTFKREYKVRKWDELSVKWTDVEEQALKKAVRAARDGVGFVVVK